MAKDFIGSEKAPLVGQHGPQSEPDTRENKKSCITVEPVAFLFMAGQILSNTTTQQFVNFVVAQQMGGDSEEVALEQTASLCSAEDDSTSVSDIQAEAAKILSAFSFLNILPMLVAAIVMGSYSDKQGRKVALVLPVVGGLLRGLVAFCVCYWQLPPQVLYAAGLSEGVCGGTAVFSTALFSYIADVSRADRRSWRMLMISITEAMGISLAEISVGYMITYCGFIAPFTLILLVYSLCLIYILAFIQESVTSWSISKAHFDFGHLGRSFKILVSNADSHQRWIMRCCTGIIFSNSIFAGIISYSTVLYLSQSPLCFTWVMMGYHLAATALAKIVLGSLSHRTLHSTLGDSGLLILAAATGALSKLWFTVPIYNIVYIYSECAVSALISLVDPVTRAVMSTAGGVEEQGAIQSLGAVMTVLGNLIGSPLASYVYSLTAEVYTGAVFAIAAAGMLVILTFTIILHCKIGRTAQRDAADKEWR